jgi:uncharacterized membrane protein YoaK (UPF0700 family)
LVVLAAHIVARDPAILSYILSVPVFMLILFLTRLLAGGLERTGVSTPRPLLLQLFSLIAFLAGCVVASPRRDADAVLAVTAGMFGVAAMAVQNALVQISLTNTPTTAVMTTNVTHFMLDLGEVLVGRDRARLAHARARASASLVHDRLVGMAARRWADLDWSALGSSPPSMRDLPTGVEAAAARGGFDWKTRFMIIYRV